MFVEFITLNDHSQTGPTDLRRLSIPATRLLDITASCKMFKKLFFGSNNSLSSLTIITLASLLAPQPTMRVRVCISRKFFHFFISNSRPTMVTPLPHASVLAASSPYWVWAEKELVRAIPGALRDEGNELSPSSWGRCSVLKSDSMVANLDWQFSGLFAHG